MLDELDLRGFFRFIAPDPVAMMYVIAPHRVIVGAGEIVVCNNFTLLVEPRDGRGGLHKGFRIWVLTQDAYSTSSMGVVQYPEAFHSTHSTDWLDFVLLQCKILLRMTPDEARQLAQRRTCNSQVS